jgi:20S proteasome alpha/beta subunit
MTQNAAIKLGLEALRESLEDDLNSDTVEIAVVNSDGYCKLDHETTLKHNVVFDVVVDLFGLKWEQSSSVES